MRLIDAEPLITEIMNKYRALCSANGKDIPKFVQMAHMAFDAVEAAPTVETKRGRWILDRDHILVCSECEEPAMQRMYYSLKDGIATFQMKKTPFCPNCGARMDGGDGHETD